MLARISANSPTDRKDLFVLLCQRLDLDLEKEKEKSGIKSMKGVNISHIVDFAYRHKLEGDFNFGEDNTLVIKYTPVEKKEPETPEEEEEEEDKKPASSEDDGDDDDLF